MTNDCPKIKSPFLSRIVSPSILTNFARDFLPNSMKLIQVETLLYSARATIEVISYFSYLKN